MCTLVCRLAHNHFNAAPTCIGSAACGLLSQADASERSLHACVSDALTAVTSAMHDLPAEPAGIAEDRVAAMTDGQPATEGA